MPTYVNPNKCDGCKAEERPACQYICPSDIMALDTGLGIQPRARHVLGVLLLR